MKIRKLLATALLGAALYAQSLTLTSSSPTVRPGQQITVTVNLAGPPAAAGIVYYLNSPAGWTPGTAVIGAAGTAASKLIKCSTVDSPRGCAIYNLTNNLIGPGVLATVPLTASLSAATGPAQFTLTKVSGASANASPVSIATSPLNITVLSLYDVNGDGTVSDPDMQPVLDQIIGTTSCATGDFNGDGKCDAIDMLLLIFKGILGL